MNKNDGMNYAPVGKPQPVVREGEFVFAAAALDHGHIYGMSNGLIEAGATLNVLRWKRFVQGEEDAFVKIVDAFSKATGVKINVTNESFDDIQP